MAAKRDVRTSPAAVRVAAARDEAAPVTEARVDDPGARVGRGVGITPAGRLAVELVEHLLGALEDVDAKASVCEG